ncbi:sulfate adenylyltransferase subunit 1 [Cryptosporangium phraense]|uniref:sulfate adenylyltransferase n=1 Tax=Cryptosporangium phraense TaxID=2593070 RepID=A0A545ALQ4_9ACTN|nr:GTP-binding protein [Cryptosporangium phraense]TQS42221.1 sulfate adenylyltransferase [Cryptosporangium phraense]
MGVTGLLRVATAGSVDDGKSTLVGRLLYDGKAVLADTLQAVSSASRARGSELDLSLLVDGLRSEREQGITIDVAHRYLSTPARDVILIDCPGHVEYTRNTVTGMSSADVALLLVDVRNGLVEQTRRHAAVAALLRVPHLILAVNKIDLTGYDQTAFAQVVTDAEAYAKEVGIARVTAVPVSAKAGDNVSVPSPSTPWYEGPTLLHLLASVEVPVRAGAPLRLPVQWVAPGRRYTGTVASGVLRPGDDVVVQPSGRRTRVRTLEDADGELDAAGEGAAAAVTLADDLHVGRGELIAAADAPADVVREFVADLAILGERPVRAGDRVLVRHTGRVVRGLVREVTDTVDIDTGRRRPADRLETNDIGRVTIAVAEPLAVDPYGLDRTTGAALLLAERTGDAIAAALVRRPEQGDR